MGASKKKAAKKRRPALFLAAIGALFLVGLIALFTADHFFGRVPPGPPVTVIIEPGASVQSAARMLREGGLIPSAEGFVLVAKAKGLAGRIRAGEFEIPRGLRPDEVLKRLVSGPFVQHRLTIPEGYTVRQVEEAIAKAGLDPASGGEADARSLLSDRAFVQSLGLPTESFEGYLFPETYQYVRGTPVRELVKKMVEQFFRVYDERMRSRQKELGLTMHEVVTLASIVEKETSSPQERGRIASVFHNRLKMNMPLASDPTVIYGLGDRFDGNLRRRDLLSPTRYNTYTMKGLPPGPICNPGKASLEAALRPQETGDLYFVSKNDGTHFFASNYAEHLKAVERYQRGKP